MPLPPQPPPQAVPADWIDPHKSSPYSASRRFSAGRFFLAYDRCEMLYLPFGLDKSPYLWYNIAQRQELFPTMKETVRAEWTIAAVGRGETPCLRLHTICFYKRNERTLWLSRRGIEWARICLF